MRRAAAVVQAWRAQRQSITRITTGFMSSRKGTDCAWRPCNFHASSSPPSTWGRLLSSELKRQGRAQAASRATCATAYLQSKHLRIFPTLCNLGCKPDFLVYHQLLSFPQQKSAHAGKTSTSVSPTLFQGHPLLQINLSVSEVTNNFNTWLV